MKKTLILFTLTSIALLSSCSTTIINGSDYISMQPGTQYHYKRTALKANKSIFIDIDIESCSNNNTKCQYFVTVKNSKDKILEQYYETYYVNFFGDVYLTDKVYPNSALLLPARITLGQEMLLNNGDRYGAVNEKLLAYKLIREIRINNHNYENCVNILFVSTTPAESVDLKLVTDEITCKDIGSVQKEMQMSYKPKYPNTSKEEISNSVMKFAETRSMGRNMSEIGYLKPFTQKKSAPDSDGFILIDTYLDILESITHTQ